MSRDWSKLKREKHTVPDFVLEALEKKKLFDAYSLRPPYQQNDYIGWITRAKLPDTKQKRLDQMLDELEHGGVYMKMKYNPKR
ncbi:MAG: YdeI/OmpD-associated family protein [Blastocatellia bacterium]